MLCANTYMVECGSSLSQVLDLAFGSTTVWSYIFSIDRSMGTQLQLVSFQRLDL